MSKNGGIVRRASHEPWSTIQARQLWTLGVKALDRLQSDAHSITLPLPGEPDDPPQFIRYTQGERAVLLGAYAMLANAGQCDIAGGLALKILQEWKPDVSDDQDITLAAYIASMKQPHQLVEGIVRLDMRGWAALYSLVVHGVNMTHMLTLINSSSVPDDRWEVIIAAFREAPIVGRVLMVR